MSHSRAGQDNTGIITATAGYDKNGNMRFETDGNGRQKENIYNELNQNTSEKITVSGVLQTTSYGYDANGNRTTETDWRGNTATNIYDCLNRLIEKRDAYDKVIEKLEYNHNNVQINSYDALDNLTQNTYDKDNRLLSTIDPENHTTSRTYDNAGNIYTRKDGNNRQTTYTYDEYNRLISVKNAKNETVSYIYDPNGNMLTQTDAKGNVTTLEYNSMNKATKRIDHGGRTGTVGNYTYDPAKTRSYTYYADGSVKTMTDRKGTITTYTYDIHGRLLNKTTGGIPVSYTYDGNGNRLTMTDPTGTTIRTYDELNRVKEKTVPVIGKTAFIYDIIAAGGLTAETSVDPKSNRTTKVYDRAGRLYQVIDGDINELPKATYSYYDDGTRKSIVYSDGSREDFTYYRDNLLCTLTNKKSDGTTLENFSYSYLD